MTTSSSAWYATDLTGPNIAFQKKKQQAQRSRICTYLLWTSFAVHHVDVIPLHAIHVHMSQVWCLMLFAYAEGSDLGTVHSRSYCLGLLSVRQMQPWQFQMWRITHALFHWEAGTACSTLNVAIGLPALATCACFLAQCLQSSLILEVILGEYASSWHLLTAL